jgi:hypothetical protein
MDRRVTVQLDESGVATCHPYIYAPFKRKRVSIMNILEKCDLRKEK